MRIRAALLGLSVFLAACSTATVSSEAQMSPQSVVENFFSLYMSGDKATALALVDEDSRAIVQGQLEGMESEGWVYKSVSVESTDGNEVTVQMEISIDGDEDSGTDQVEVLEKDGKWWIVDLPS